MHDSLQVRFLFLPDGEDPDSLIRKESREQFEKRMLNGTSLSEFFFQTIGKQADMNTMEGRARFATLALNHIKQLPSGIFHTMMMTELGKRSRVDVENLKAQIPAPASDTPQTSAGVIDDTQIKNKLPAPVRLALALLVQNPALAKLCKETFPETNLYGAPFLQHLINKLNNHPASLTTGSLLESFRGQKEESFIAKMAHYEHLVPDAAVESSFIGSLRQIRALVLEEEINRLMAKAAQEGLSDNEKQALNAAISQKKTSAATA
jgi:DNA primase